MNDKSKKIIILNTGVLFLCIIMIALFSFVPNKEIEEVEVFTIKFDTAGGNGLSAIKVEDGKYVMPNNPSREGYIFLGWYYNGEPFDFNMGITEDITLVAMWKEIDASKNYYTINFNTNGGGDIPSQYIEEETLVIRPQDPTKEGFNFIEWQLDGVAFTFQEPVNRDMELVAFYEEVVLEPGEKTYTVRFNAGGGSLVSGCNIQTVKEGEKAKNSCTVSRSGYTFTGWSPSIDSVINANTTFTAQWTQNSTPDPEPPTPEPQITYYRVSFDLNGGSGNGCNAQTVEEGKTASNTCNPSKSHYTFTGWDKNISTPIYSNTTFVASWSKSDIIITKQDVTDGVTFQGYKILVSGDSSGVTAIKMCFGGGAVCTTVAPGGIITGAMYYDQMDLCEATVNGEIFNCRK